MPQPPQSLMAWFQCGRRGRKQHTCCIKEKGNLVYLMFDGSGSSGGKQNTQCSYVLNKTETETEMVSSSELNYKSRFRVWLLFLYSACGFLLFIAWLLHANKWLLLTQYTYTTASSKLSISRYPFLLLLSPGDVRTQLYHIYCNASHWVFWYLRAALRG